MAVDAQRLFAAGHHQPSSAALGLVGRAGAAMPMTGAAAAAFSPACYGAAAGNHHHQQQHQGLYLSSPSSYMGLAQPAPPPQAPPGGQMQDQYTGFLALAAADLAKRGVRLDASQQIVGGYKRKRDEQQDSSPVPGAASVLAAHAQQQAAVVDRILVKHATNMWTALAEQRKKQMGLIITAVEARAAKRLKAKDEEIDRIRSMNWALEDRLRNLYVEAQMWRDMAQSSEAAANALRGDLQRALDAQAVRAGGCGGDVEDAGSCCWGDNNCGDDEEEEEVRTPAVVPSGVGRCKGCGEGAAVVLLLPCRHLCVCASCGDTARACPACGCAKNGTSASTFPDAGKE
uniref:Uncharacterized protein n=1 Tax=Avena sativa TaxID=4498 RepID=A0ACD5WAB0_AVESA